MEKTDRSTTCKNDIESVATEGIMFNFMLVEVGWEVLSMYFILFAESELLHDQYITDWSYSNSSSLTAVNTLNLVQTSLRCL